MTGGIVPPGELELVDRHDLERRLEAIERAPKLYPPLLAPVRPGPGGAIGWAQAFVAVTGGAWVTAWSAWIPYLAHEGLTFTYGALTDVTGAADIRVRLTAAGGVDVTTAVVAIAPNTYTAGGFRWIHALPLWTTTDVTVALEARVATANFSIFPPYGGGVLFAPATAGEGMTPTGI